MGRMELHGIDELMRHLKGRYDSSERRHEWRALSGRDHTSGKYDTFIFSEDRVYQIRSAEVSPRRMVAVGGEVGSNSPDLFELTKSGSPIPLGVISKATDASAIVMLGMQQYSSDVADVLRNEHFHSRQDRLEGELEAKLDKLLERPEFRTSYRRLREDQNSYFA
ncbi:MAG: hypothetical protein MUO87_08030 [Thermoplasmata archaeon]|nr:hypothetical protein [Thermoplasmata archaeon]